MRGEGFDNILSISLGEFSLPGRDAAATSHRGLLRSPGCAQIIGGLHELSGFRV